LQVELPIDELEPEQVDAYVVQMLGADEVFEVEPAYIQSIQTRSYGVELRLEDAVEGDTYEAW
jgi:hypothetical protein